MKKSRIPLRIESLEQRAMLTADLGLGVGTELDTSVFEVAAPIDGVGNNLENPEWGSTGEQLLRNTTVEYADGVSEPAGEDRLSAREISNLLAAQSESLVNERGLSDLLWLWGQFIDHDIDLTEGADPAEAFNIEVPTGDVHFDPFATGAVEIGLNRSVYDPDTGDSMDDPRQQINQITAFLDGSVVYGSDHERADELRTLSGGLLKTSEGDLLPFNEAGLENAGGPSDTLFLAGDVRANENVALSAMHTLWVREHNRIATELAEAEPELTDEQLYQRARAIVTAELQAITYNEFLPALLGVDAISEYQGYDPSVNSSIANVFSTAAYRLGHSMLSSELLRLSHDGTTADEGNISLQNAFFSPDELVDNGIDSILLGVASQRAQELDNQVIDDVRNFLFGPPGAGGFDLVSLNIQRGRDHGLADYNQTRIDYGLEPVSSFSEITSDPELADALEAAYGDVNNIDVWVGGLAEDHVAGGSMGELFQTILTDQFERIRDGDRFWYQNLYTGEALEAIESTTLADVIARNTEIDSLQENVFFEPSVFYFEVDADMPRTSITLTNRGDEYQVINQRNGRVLARAAMEDTTRIVIVGGAGDDTIRVNLAPEFAPTEGVVVEGSGGHDRLVTGGGSGRDRIPGGEGEIDFNGLLIAFDVEHVNGGGRDDGHGHDHEGRHDRHENDRDAHRRIAINQSPEVDVTPQTRNRSPGSRQQKRSFSTDRIFGEPDLLDDLMPGADEIADALSRGGRR